MRPFLASACVMHRECPSITRLSKPPSEYVALCLAACRVYRMPACLPGLPATMHRVGCKLPSLVHTDLYCQHTQDIGPPCLHTPVPCASSSYDAASPPCNWSRTAPRVWGTLGRAVLPIACGALLLRGVAGSGLTSDGGMVHRQGTCRCLPVSPGPFSFRQQRSGA